MLDAHQILIRIFPTSVECATPIVSPVQFTIIQLYNFWLNMQLKQSDENVSAYVPLESSLNPEELGQLKEGVGSQLMHLNWKLIQNRRKRKIARKSQAGCEKIPENNNLIWLRRGSLFRSRSTAVISRKNPFSL